MTKDLMVAGTAVRLQELMTEAKADGAEKKVIKCEIDSGLYKSKVEEAGFKYEDVAKVNEFNHTYINSITEDVVKAGVQVLEENKDADRVAFIAPYLADNITSRTSRIEIAVDRSKTITIPGKGQEERPAYSLNVVNKFENVSGTIATDLKALMMDKLAKN